MEPTVTDREPQPSDGPDYHADHTAWARRSGRPTVTDEQTRPSQQQIAAMMAAAGPWTVLGTAIDDATVRNMTRGEALAVFEHVRYVLDACGLTVVNLNVAVAAGRPTVTDQTAAHPCIYCTGQFCANAGSGSKPCCPDCSGTLHHVRPDVAADLRNQQGTAEPHPGAAYTAGFAAGVAAEREACADVVWDAAHAGDVTPEVVDAATRVMAAIRNRGEA